MSDLRTAAQQALEAWQGHQHGKCSLEKAVERFDALRAAMAQQVEPDHETRAELAEQQVVQLAEERDHFRNLWQKAQQAEPVEPHRWEGDNNIESPFNACMHKTYCMTLKQAEPLNLSDPSVRKRLAAQWGYVQQAEPAQEPVAGVVLNDEGRAALVEHGTEDWHCALRNARRLYTAPPRRTMVPLTEEEIERIGMTHQSLRQVARAIEKASWEKNHG